MMMMMLGDDEDLPKRGKTRWKMRWKMRWKGGDSRHGTEEKAEGGRDGRERRTLQEVRGVRGREV